MSGTNFKKGDILIYNGDMYGNIDIVCLFLQDYPHKKRCTFRVYNDYTKKIYVSTFTYEYIYYRFSYLTKSNLSKALILIRLLEFHNEIESKTNP